MPLLGKTTCPLLEPPEDLKREDRVFQVRFTKEIFRDYKEYVKRMDFYRQRIWTCKISGKANLTYEEALVSEKLAAEKVQEIPKELVEPALRVIQFSMLSLKRLAKTISAKLKEYKFVGDELHGRKGESWLPCKILKILEDSNGKTCYEIKWLENSNKVTETSVVNGNDLIRKKKPWSRDILKSFIMESTYRTEPWVLHDQLAEKHGISNNPPEELKGKVFILNGIITDKKRRSVGDGEEMGNSKKRKGGGEIEVTDVAKSSETEAKQADPIKYPIDDLLLVQPAANDPVFTERPLPSRDFNVPADCIGDLLLVWDYCSSFGRLLNLWPFPLEDFEKAICRKDSDLILIAEIHSALLCLLLKGNGDRFFSAQRRTKKSKITLVNWTGYLCDFIEKIDHPVLSASTSTIKRGHYGLLDIQVKLGILHELVNEAVGSALFRKKMDECVEQRQLLSSAYRAEALEEARKKREKERSKIADVVNVVGNGHCVVDSEGLQRNRVATVNQNSEQNGVFVRRPGGFSSEENRTSDRSDNDHSETASKKIGKGHNMDVESETEIGDNAAKQFPDEKKGGTERSAYQRREEYNREMEKLVVRTEPLGKDRHYQRYWWFQRDGRIFVESSDCKEWGFYSSKEELNALIGSLNYKGERELALRTQLEKWHRRICAQMEKRSKDLARKTLLNDTVLRRSTRVQATPRESPATSYLRYVNKWKEE